MIKEYLTFQDWKITLYLVDTDYDTKEVLEALWNLGCTASLALEAYKDMEEIKYNIGFTYSNYITKEAIILIGKLESEYQIINTIAHESRHLLLYIANSRGLDLNGEEVCYILGYLVQEIYHKCVIHKIL